MSFLNFFFVFLQMEISPNLPFSQAFDFASEAVAERFQNPFWKLKEFFVGSQLRRAIKEVKKFGRRIVSVAALQREAKRRGMTTCQEEKFIDEDINGTNKLRTANARSSPINESENLINSLLDHIDDQQIVADAAMNYLSAGLFYSPFPSSTCLFLFHLIQPQTMNPSLTINRENTGRDTTAQSLTWTFYLLMRHPSTTTKIITELPLLSSISNPNSTPKTTNTYTLESLFPSSLPYTNAVFYESLRLYPPVPIEIKETSQRATLPDGTVLPSGAIVMYIPWAMNRCIKLWGKTAHDFLPDRWLSSPPSPPSASSSSDDSHHHHHQKKKIFSTNNKSAYEFPVFNAGPRTCLGKKFAEALAIAVLVSLVPKYHFTLLSSQVPPTNPGPGDNDDDDDDAKAKAKGHKGHERKSRNSLTLPMDGGLPCLVRRRDMYQ